MTIVLEHSILNTMIYEGFLKNPGFFLLVWCMGLMLFLEF